MKEKDIIRDLLRLKDQQERTDKRLDNLEAENERQRRIKERIRQKLG
jgi:hypothetical protein